MSLSDNPAFDFISSFFVPVNGINEYPVCGSTHRCLGHYWSEQLGRISLTVYQASARGGTLCLQSETNRVSMGGVVVTFMQGAIYV